MDTRNIEGTFCMYKGVGTLIYEEYIEKELAARQDNEGADNNISDNNNKKHKYMIHFLDVERLKLKKGDIIGGPFHEYDPLYRGIYKGRLFKGLVEKVNDKKDIK